MKESEITEEFVIGFGKSELTPIDLVEEFTGLSRDEIKNSFEVVEVATEKPQT